MTDLAVRSDIDALDVSSNDAPLPTRYAPVSAFSQWIEDARQLGPIAVSLAKTSFVPKAFQGKPAEITAAILAGQEVGMKPMASLRSIDVIEGKPGLSALALRALVQSHGHDIWTVESTATRAIVKGQRRGSERIETSTWTMDRAKQFELHTKANWRKQPTSMLLARATSEVARLVDADGIAGMPYSAEELRDEVVDDTDGTVIGAGVEPEKPAKRTTKRRPLEPMPSAEPELTPPGEDPNFVPSADVEPDEAEAVEMITDDQRREMFALWNDLGFGGDANREQRLAITASILKLTEPLESSSDLTEADAAAVIAALRARKEAQGGES